jgi:hypothetical protein
MLSKRANFIVFFWLTLISSTCYAQFSDNFDDGDLGLNPLWIGETNVFITNGSGQLQLNNEPVTDVAYISSALSLDFSSQIIWEFWMQLNFDPSVNNNARFYLSSDSPNLEGSLNGYYIRLGENGAEDALTLYRQNGLTSTELLSGTANIYATSPICRVRVVREANGIWSISSDALGGNSFVPEGSIQDETFSTMNYLGWYCKFTSTNSTGFLLDDVSATGNVLTDITSPVAQSVSVIDAQNIDITFSESLDASSAENTSNYNVVGIGNPSLAVLDGGNPSVVHLSFASAFPANIEQTISIEGIEDLSGNASILQSLNFTYVVAAIASYRQVVFNEIFADPTPTFGLPETEFLELYNTSESFFNLQDWKLVNTTTEMNLPSFILAPNAYVILCASGNEEGLQLYGDVIPLSFTALTNTADSLTLMNELGTVLDIVSYTDEWYNDPDKMDGGWTLEQINPEFQCSGAFNWTASNNPSGGSPGAANSVLDLSPDVTAPSIISTSYTENGILVIEFNEPFDPSITDDLIFSFTSGPGVISVAAGSNLSSIIIELDDVLAIGVEYEYTLEGLQDCSGNQSGILEGTIIIGFSPEPGDLIINEIMADPSPVIGLPEAEYLEIYNKSNKLIELSYCQLNGLPLPSKLIAPGAYEVIVDDATAQAEPFFSDALSVEGWSSTYLTNTGRDIVLRDSEQNIIDSLRYELSWYVDGNKDDGGWSIERISPDDPCSDIDNWRASVAAAGGTPGNVNSVNDLSPDTSSPELLTVYVLQNDLISLVFSEPIDVASATTASYSFTNNLAVDNISVGASPTKEVQIELIPAMTPGVIYEITINGLSDCWGNGVSGETGRFAIADVYVSGDIIINEILSDPKTGGSDFIELYNRSMRNISLQGWQLANEDAGIPADYSLITENPVMLFPGEYLALTSGNANLQEFYPGTVIERVHLMESLPTYNNDEGVVYLLDPLAQEIDKVAYSSEWHFALLDNTDGVSLERINSESPSQSADNWHSAAETEGFATPGYLNSQAFDGAMQEGDFYAEPEVFSPDNDGYQDVLTLFYELETSGQVGNITIYDDSGRTIRNLVRNDLLGTSGSYTWDGIGEKNEKAAVGIYIVVLELFDLEGNTSIKKIPCVVAHPF